MSQRPWQFATSAVLVLSVMAVLCFGSSTRAQSAAQDNRSAPDTALRSELAQFGQFLDGHPEIAEQLRKDPSVVDNRDFVRNHPALDAYLRSNPGVRDQFRRDPNAFMQDEERFNRDASLRDRDVTRSDVVEFNRFLDTHPEIAEQLRKDPSLVDNPSFVRNHPALETYLKDNPGVRDELRQDPNAFMRQEDAVARTDVGRDRDASRPDLVNFDRFLDNHREIGEQLRKNPSLADNHDFVQGHPALLAYLQDNPDVRDQLRRDPNAFMQDEDRFDNRDAARDHMASFGEFLGGHSSIAGDISRDPSLVNNHDYVQSHPELDAYLNAHAEVRNDWTANPQGFVKGSQQFTTSGSATGGASIPGATTTGGSNPSGSPTTNPGSAPRPKQ
jgi:hypothetical protein